MDDGKTLTELVEEVKGLLVVLYGGKIREVHITHMPDGWRTNTLLHTYEASFVTKVYDVRDVGETDAIATYVHTARAAQAEAAVRAVREEVKGRVAEARKRFQAAEV
jgi:hypothetical protein